jgi:hypothetical protein
MNGSGINWVRLLGNEASSFDHTTYDAYEFESLLDFSPTMSKRDEENREEFDRSVVRDAFFCLMGLGVVPNDALHSAWTQARMSDAYPRLLQAADEDRYGLAAATLYLSSAVENSMRQATPTKPEPAPMPAIAGGSTEGESEESAEDALAPGGDGGSAGEKVDGGGEPTAVSISVSAEAMEQAAASAEDVRSIVQAGGAGLGNSPVERFENALELQAAAHIPKGFSNLLGWARQIVRGASRMADGGNEDLRGYKPGGWTPSVVPRQQMAVAQRDPLALAALADNALTQRVHRSDRPMGKGPVILMRDESGSMAGMEHKIAVSLELALAQAFREERRDLVTLRWASGTAPVGDDGWGDKEKHYSIRYTHGEQGLKKHLQSFWGAGTSLAEPMREALKVAEEYVDGADILVLTDGDAHTRPSNELLRPYRKSGGKVWAVLIGQGVGRVDWADGQIHVDHLNDKDKLAELVSKISKRYDSEVRRGGRKVT